MSCERCAGAFAWIAQLESAVRDKERYEERLLELIAKEQRTIRVLERDLRDAKDELRIRRAAMVPPFSDSLLTSVSTWHNLCHQYI